MIDTGTLTIYESQMPWCSHCNGCCLALRDGETYCCHKQSSCPPTLTKNLKMEEWKLANPIQWLAWCQLSLGTCSNVRTRKTHKSLLGCIKIRSVVSNNFLERIWVLLLNPSFQCSGKSPQPLFALRHKYITQSPLEYHTFRSDWASFCLY